MGLILFAHKKRPLPEAALFLIHDNHCQHNNLLGQRRCVAVAVTSGIYTKPSALVGCRALHILQNLVDGKAGRLLSGRILDKGRQELANVGLGWQQQEHMPKPPVLVMN
jgi:hypothetical protein